MFKGSQIKILIVVSMLLSIRPASAAESDPLIGTYKANDGRNYRAVVKKLILSKGSVHTYKARVEVSRLLTDDNRKPVVLEGYGEVFSPDDDKMAEERVFVYLSQKTPNAFLEIIPGRKSSPRNVRGFATLNYFYFEKSPENSAYVRSELVRVFETKK